MMDFDIQAPSFQAAELRSECTRVRALLAVLGTLLGLTLIRGIVSVIEGRTGEAWPFVVALVVMATYEGLWLKFVVRAMDFAKTISKRMWEVSVFAESLLPTVALFLQIQTAFIGPHRVLTSPVVLAYFVFIILSTLHLDPTLCRLCGVFSAAGYGAVAIYVFVRFPEVATIGPLFVYSTAFTCMVLMVLGGFAAGAVAGQIRSHVMRTLQEAEVRTRIEHDLGVARTVQQGLLPKAPPHVEGFDIAGWNRPADETGGDYFDWEVLPDGLLAISIADVTGHGIGAALCMAACRAYARAALVETPSLRDFFGSMNQLLYEDLPKERFVTMATGILDPEDGCMELISAGHGPLMFYLAAEDRFRSYDAHGVPLGLMPEFRYGCPQVVRFARGDILALVTDGFIEWANSHDEEFGQARLKAVIRANRNESAATIISELHSAIARFAGPVPQPDDLTVVIVKRADSGSSERLREN